jgi:hypothetical protein
MDGDGFGRTWLTNWRLAADKPVRALLFLFVVCAVGVGVTDYFITTYRSIRLSAGLGLVCGAVVALVARRKLRTYRSDAS